MGMVYLHGHFTDTKKEFNHAFNVIYTSEGLTYVEPQTDEIWWYANHSEIPAGNEIEFGKHDPPLRIHVDRIDTIVSP
jgi:hypothetical protein